MAGIDKTYTDNYGAYKEFKDWADKQFVVFFDGHKECIGDWVWDLTEEDFEYGERAIMNTPTWVDIYLIQHCKIPFVAERLENVYDQESYNEFLGHDFTKLPNNFKQGRKVRISKTKRSRFPKHNKPYGIGVWFVDSRGCDYMYNSETKRWVSRDMYYPYDSSVCFYKSVRHIVRDLQQQYLPKGVQFAMHGRYVGESYEIELH